MTDADIAQAKARAQDVIDGFMTIHTRQARDVVKLANELQIANRIIDAVRRHEQDKNKRPEPPSFFDVIFGGKK